MLIVRQKGGGSFAIRLGNVTLDRVRRVFCRGRLQPQWRSSLQWSLHTEEEHRSGYGRILPPSSGLLFHLPSTLVNRKALLVLCLLQKTAPRSKSRTGNPSLLKELGRCCATGVTTVTNFQTPRGLPETQAHVLGPGCNVNLLPLPERLDAILCGSDKKRLLVHPRDVDQAPAVVDGARVDRSSADT